MLDREGALALGHVHDRVQAGPFRTEQVSEGIRASWYRDAAAGLRPEQIHPPYDADVDDDSLLHWAAAPAMSAVSADLPEVRSALLLTDERVHVVARWTRTAGTAIQMDAVGAAPGFFCSESLVGTNSIGMAMRTRRTSLVRGFEHYADAFVELTCASRAVVDPSTGLVLGVVNMTVADPAPWQLMAALVGRVAHETELRLREGMASWHGEQAWARLTQAELRVAQLVATGLTNREVAGHLFLSTHTVDYHLRHIFRKLDIDSRTHLARIAERNAASAL